MRQEDLKEMAERCRSLADRADVFTKKRLLDLASKYEARSQGRSIAAQRLISAARRDDRATANAAAKRIYGLTAECPASNLSSDAGRQCAPQ